MNRRSRLVLPSLVCSILALPLVCQDPGARQGGQGPGGRGPRNETILVLQRFDALGS